MSALTLTVDAGDVADAVRGALLEHEQRTRAALEAAGFPADGLSRACDVAIDADAMRELEATRAAGGDADERVAIIISTEYPVRRYDWRTGKYFDEVLAHEPGAVDMARAKRGLAFLLGHDSRDQFGIVEGVKLGTDGKLRGLVRFSRSARAQEIRTDMLDGIRTSLSVGYSVGEQYVETSDADGNVTRRYTRWQPFEVSSVPIPADPSAVVGRAALAASAASSRAAVPPAAPPAGNPESMTPETNTGAAGGTAVAPPNVTAGAAPAAAPTREQMVYSMCEAAGMGARETRELVESGKSLREIGDAVIAAARAAEQRQTVRTPAVELSTREQGRYSMLRAMNAAVQGNWQGAGLEREVSEAIRLRLGRPGGATTFYVPTNVGVTDTRSQLSVGTANKGGNIVETALESDMIALLRNRSLVLSQLGARWIPGLVGNVAFPRQIAAAVASWVGEAPGSPIANTSLTIDQVSLSPKTLMAATTVSKQLLAQTDVGGGAENIIREDLVAQFATALDAAALMGNTGGNNPVGAVYATGVGAQAIGANGGTFSLALFLAGMKALETANALTDNTTFVTNVSSKYSMIAAQRVTGTDSRTLWDNATGRVEGIRSYGSNNLPASATFNKGTTTDGTLAPTVMGDWSHAMVGEWANGVEITVDPYTLALRNLVQVSAIQFLDVQFRIPGAFVRWLDTK